MGGEDVGTVDMKFYSRNPDWQSNKFKLKIYMTTLGDPDYYKALLELISAH